VVEDMELSAEDIATLRSAERALYNRPGLQDLIKSMADRLSPPEPEQPDEATVWTRKVLHAEYQITAYATGEMDDRAQFINARRVLSELIASKDAEIAKAQLWAMKQHKCADEYASELTALRAENERLKNDALQKKHGARIAYDMKMPPYPYQTPNIGGSMAFRTAAERNPAGPGPWPGDPDHRETMPVDTAPVVEVTAWANKQADLVDRAHSIITEAEARGRREALEKTDDEWREIIRKVFAAAKICPAHYSYNPLAAIRELKRLMTEGK